MIKPTTRFSDLPWYGPALDLGSNYPWKGNVTKIEAVRANGNGFDSNTTAAFASLSVLVPGKTYRLDLKNIPPGGVEIDNGTQPVGENLDTLELDIPAGSGTNPYEETLTLQTHGLTYKVGVYTNASTGAAENGTVRFRLDGGSLLTYDAFNAAAAAVKVSEIKAGGHTYTIVASVASDAACYLNIR